jgi:hypothetical protein
MSRNHSLSGCARAKYAGGRDRTSNRTTLSLVGRLMQGLARAREPAPVGAQTPFFISGVAMNGGGRNVCHFSLPSPPSKRASNDRRSRRGSRVGLEEPQMLADLDTRHDAALGVAAERRLLSVTRLATPADVTSRGLNSARLRLTPRSSACEQVCPVHHRLVRTRDRNVGRLTKPSFRRR